MANFYVKYNQDKVGLCPWELWYGSKRVDCFVTRSTANEICDLKNEMMELLKNSKVGERA